MKKVKLIHLTRVRYGCTCVATCAEGIGVAPIEATIRIDYKYSRPKGTFNPKKVTCKRCLKHKDYKEALDKVNNPLFYWKENTA